MPDLCVITSHPPSWRDFAKIMHHSKDVYCNRHGYEFVCNVSEARDPSYDNLPIRGFIKFEMLERVLAQYEAVLWVDADAAFTNDLIRIEDLMNIPKDIIVPWDINGINATVMLFKNTPDTRDYVWAVNHLGREFFMRHPHREMEAMRYFSATPPYHELLGYLSVKELCGYLVDLPDYRMPAGIATRYQWSPGDWILHLPALPLERRISLARDLVAKYGLGGLPEGVS